MVFVCFMWAQKSHLPPFLKLSQWNDPHFELLIIDNKLVEGGGGSTPELGGVWRGGGMCGGGGGKVTEGCEIFEWSLGVEEVTSLAPSGCKPN